MKDPALWNKLERFTVAGNAAIAASADGCGGDSGSGSCGGG